MADGEKTASPDDLVTVVPPSGWYQDPDNASIQRYWDGANWVGKERRDISSARPFPGVQQVRRGELPKVALPREVLARRLLVTPALELPGYRIVEHRSEVFGLTVRTRNMFSDALAGLRNTVGGEARGYTKMLADARDEAMLRMRLEALDAGADAIVSMRLTTNQIGDSMTEIAAYGAAVRIEALSAPAEDLAGG